MNRWSIMAVLLTAAMAFSGCMAAGERGAAAQSQSQASSPPTQAEPSGKAIEPEPGGLKAPSLPEAEGEPVQAYVNSLVAETVAQFAMPDMSDFEKVKAAFDYMIETTTLLDPVGLELWRVRTQATGSPSFVENRALSVLQHQLGKCEDYAAALTLLLQGMGLEAVYVPGLTYSTQGELVDHAWTVVQVDGTWYHLDCQLEQNISRHGSIRYKYFLRSDDTMAGSHRWGQNLINTRLLTDEQNEEIARDFIPPACPRDYPTPDRHSFTLADTPDVAALEAEIEAEIQEYEKTHGPLEPLELNIVPPVFALEGYGPQD